MTAAIVHPLSPAGNPHRQRPPLDAVGSLDGFRFQVSNLPLDQLHELQEALTIAWNFCDGMWDHPFADQMGDREDIVWAEVQSRPEFQWAVEMTARHLRERRSGR
jgi:hypothetical protein